MAWKSARRCWQNCSSLAAAQAPDQPLMLARFDGAVSARIHNTLGAQPVPVLLQAVLQRRGAGFRRARVQDQAPAVAVQDACLPQQTPHSFLRSEHAIAGLHRPIPFVAIKKPEHPPRGDGRIRLLHCLIHGGAPLERGLDQPERIESLVIMQNPHGCLPG